ncbi:MAG: riboflavin kinase [Planctomycetota bacterium]
MDRSIVTVGNFDGVHLGHRKLIDAARAMAQRNGARVVAITFDPAPAAVLNPGHEPPRIETIDRRVERLREAGVNEVVVVHPDGDWLSREAEGFVQDVAQQHAVAGWVEGPGFRFGRARRGDMTLLRAMGLRLGFEVQTVEPAIATLFDGSIRPASSSLARWLLGRGRTADAAAVLGRPFEMRGAVVRGDQRGRTIGVPTANLDPDRYAGAVVPRDGVYAGAARILDDLDDADAPEAPEFCAAISVGVKPTFAGRALTIEAHLLGYAPDDPDALYGRSLSLRFGRFLRDAWRFPSAEALRAQLARDLADARMLAGSSPMPSDSPGRMP